MWLKTWSSLKLFLSIVGDGSNGQKFRRIVKKMFFQVMLRNRRALNVRNNTYNYVQ